MLPQDLTSTRIAIVGGCGHVGLPLGVRFARAGAHTVLVDIDEHAVASVNAGRFPFLERDGDRELALALEAGLRATTDPAGCRDAHVVVFVTGTPIDEHHNPKLSDVVEIVDSYREHMPEDGIVVMRSTLFPGTMDHLAHKLEREGLDVRLAFCPERVAQGQALEEIGTLPQIVSAFDDETFEEVARLFAPIVPSVIRLSPIEAEMAKLFTNAWRYIEFAIANQFYMIAESKGVDFHRVYQALRHDYPRAQAYRSPGFTAGPCLFKDTMQLSSFMHHRFALGRAAMLVNEELAPFVVEAAARRFDGDLRGRTVGLLGMTFKADSDDTRQSLSFKVRKLLHFRGAEVRWHDPYLEDSDRLEDVLGAAAVTILCVPHREYRDLVFPSPPIDVWGVTRSEDLDLRPGRDDAGSAPPSARGPDDA